MERPTSIFLRYNFTALVFRPGRDGRPIARIGRLVVFPGRGEIVQLGAPYRPERFVDRERYAVAIGLRPVTRSLTATVRGGVARGFISVLPWTTVEFELPARVPDTDTPMVGRVQREHGALVFAAYPCSRCGEMAVHEIGAGAEYLCEPCYREWKENLVPPENGPNPFGEDISYAHSFEGDW